MLSIIEVQCPHCGARGQIMVPPVGAIIIGPCPQCKELVVVFCGQVLPLNKEIMESGLQEDRQEHLLSVLNDFLRDRVTKLMTEGAAMDEYPTGEEFEAQDSPEEEAREAVSPKDLITQNEFDRFIDVDLKLLDNDAYFKSVFERKES